MLSEKSQSSLENRSYSSFVRAFQGSPIGKSSSMRSLININVPSRTMFIRTQDTPNPNSLKFYPGTQVTELTFPFSI